MDRKSIPILIVCLLLLVLWPRLVQQFRPPIQVPVTNQVVTATAPTGTNVVAGSTNAVPIAAVPPTGATTATPPHFDLKTPEQTITLSNANARYVFTSRGGGLQSVDLLRFPESLSTIRNARSSTGEVVTLNDAELLPIGMFLDDSNMQGNAEYTLTPTATGVRAEKTLPNGLNIVKDFAVNSNYLVTASVRLENHGTAPLTLPLREMVVGTATPSGPQERAQMLGVMWYNGKKADQTASTAWFENQSFLSCVTHNVKPRSIYQGGSNDVVWAASHNQFFTLIAMPAKPVAGVVVRPVDLPTDEFDTGNKAMPKGCLTTFTYPAVTLAPGQENVQTLQLFAGPKEYRTLAGISEQLTNNVEVVMGYGGFTGGISRALLLAMNWLHDFISLPYGWCIIAITVIIKVVFWPLTAASTRSMKRMQALQPQMAAIKEKYKDDPVKMNRKTMEFMKENKVSPLGGCLPMVIQLPIFFGFYRMILSAIELRGASFLWIGDLSRPDTLFMSPYLHVPFNLLPLIMGATQLWQASLTPPSPGMDPAQQKLMRFMPLMFLFILYNFSAGLTLYWTIQNLLTVVQTKLTKTQLVAAPAAAAPAKKKK